MSVRIEILHVKDCPHAPEAVRRVGEATADRDVEVDVIEVHTDDQAAAHGMRGSPTILIDGLDPFTPPGVPVGVACRIAPGGDPLPTVDELRAAVDAAPPRG